MQYRRLGNTDMKVSALGFGASALGGVFSDSNESAGIRTVHAAIDHGINYVDVSPFYGNTVAETVLGKALKSMKRERYFLATKTGRFANGHFDFSPKSIAKSVQESLHRLGVDYLDVLQLHDIEYQNRKHLPMVIAESIPYLHELKNKGIIRYVGITSYPIEVFRQVHEAAKVDTMLCHGHYMLSDTQMTDLLPYAANDGIGLVAASPLGMGLLTKRGVADWHPASIEDKMVVQKAVAFCENNGTTLERLALQFGVSNASIPVNLVSTSNEQRIIDNIKTIEEPIDESLLLEVQKILAPIRNKDYDFAKHCELM